MTTRFHYPTKDVQDELNKIARALVAPGKGILCADETIPIMAKRFQEIGVVNSEENRRVYRQLLFTTDASLSEHISGVVVSHETLYQLAEDCSPFVDLLKGRGILVGIKVDKGIVDLYGSENECTTQGLDGLAERCQQYKKDGCDFAKWRCVLKIGRFTPSHQAIMENANVLARYASICQSNKLVPIVEPHILTDGDHNLEQAQKVTETVLAAVFKALNDHHVLLEGILLNPSLIVPGVNNCRKYTPEQVGQATVEALRRTVPPAVPGITFLASCLAEECASVLLNAVNLVNMPKPWMLTFAFGSALQMSVLRSWAGDQKNVQRAQNELLQRAKANGLASLGQYVAGSIPTFAGEKIVDAVVFMYKFG